MSRLDRFVHDADSPRVVFGAGSLDRLDDELYRLGVRRVLVVCTPGQRRIGADLVARMGARGVGLFDQAEMHVPLAVALAARKRARELGADAVVAYGGGSTIGLAKAIALERDVAIVAIPTTYSGSEMTPVHGITDGGLKTTGRDARVLPRTVIYDPHLTLGLPVALSVTSGINAMAHAAEGLYARDGNPIASLMAEEGLRALARGLRALARDASDVAARSRCLYGSWLCGSVLAQVGMALHHKLCHVLGGSFGLPHAETHTVILPHALAYNRAAAPFAMERIAHAIERDDAPEGLFDLAHELGAPTSLRALGLAEADLDRAATLVMANPYWNPRTPDTASIRELLQDAYDGLRPALPNDDDNDEGTSP